MIFTVTLFVATPLKLCLIMCSCVKTCMHVCLCLTSIKVKDGQALALGLWIRLYCFEYDSIYMHACTVFGLCDLLVLQACCHRLHVLWLHTPSTSHGSTWTSASASDSMSV